MTVSSQIGMHKKINDDKKNCNKVSIFEIRIGLKSKVNKWFSFEICKSSKISRVRKNNFTLNCLLCINRSQ